MDAKDEVFQVIIHMKGGGVEVLVSRQYTNNEGIADGPGRVLDGAGSASPVLNDRVTVAAAQKFVEDYCIPAIAARHGVPVAKMGMIDAVAAVDARIAEEERVAKEKADAEAKVEEERLEAVAAAEREAENAGPQ